MQNPDRSSNLFQTDGRLSLARIHVLVGGFFILCGIVELIWPNARLSGLGSVTFFVISIIIVAVGAASLPLETRLVRLPARVRAWAISSGRGTSFVEKATADQAQPLEGSTVATTAAAQTGSIPGGAPGQAIAVEWSPRRDTLVHRSLLGDGGRPDLAVIQLVVGIIVVPSLSMFPRVAAIGWHLVAITVLSEIVYLSFLGARLIKVAELTDIARQMRATRLQRKSQDEELAGLQRAEADPDRVKADQERAKAEPDRVKAEQERAKAEQDRVKADIQTLDRVQDALDARANALWRQLGFMFE
jgi:hypothetical protein